MQRGMPSTRAGADGASNNRVPTLAEVEAEVGPLCAEVSIEEILAKIPLPALAPEVGPRFAVLPCALACYAAPQQGWLV